MEVDDEDRGGMAMTMQGKSHVNGGLGLMFRFEIFQNDWLL
jgi:hypothetical protein